MTDWQEDIHFGPPFERTVHLRGTRRMYPKVPWGFYILALAGCAVCAVGLLGEQIRGFATVSLVVILVVLTIVLFFTFILPRVVYAFVRSKVARLAEFSGRATKDGIVLDVGAEKTLVWPWDSLRVHAADEDLVVVSNQATGIITLAREIFASQEEWAAVRDRIGS